jgi:hypothetical protein
MPYNLLVEGDIVELAYGDTAPCKCQFIYPKDTDPVKYPPIFLHRTTTLKVSHFDNLPGDKGLLPKELRMNSPNPLRHRFVLLETPLACVLPGCLQYKRPVSPWKTAMSMLGRILFLWNVTILVLSFATNLLRLFLLPTKSISIIHWSSYVFLLQAYAILPSLPLALDAVASIARFYGDALCSALVHALQKSSTPYLDVDPYDPEAAPPTKDIQVPHVTVLQWFIASIVGVPGRRGASGLFDSLGNVTVLCVLDKEGCIASVS